MKNWIWYPGDFEIYQGMIQNFDREERGFFWPAYWYVADCKHNVKFIQSYNLEEETTIKVVAIGKGGVNVKTECERPFFIPESVSGPFYKDNKYPIGEVINIPKGKVIIEIVVCNPSGLPSVFVEGDVIFSDKNWKVTDLAAKEVAVGYNSIYTKENQNPNIFEYTSKLCKPICTEEVNGGVLYDFGQEITAETIIEFPLRRENITLCYGESRKEALDVVWCYLKQKLDTKENSELYGAFETELVYRSKLRAFRYIFIPEGVIASVIKVKADYKYVDFPQRSYFLCENERINQIWKVSDITFRLASGAFFLDGIKRDRWIWSGDAYQSYFINQYLFSDNDICKRTILALRGNDPVVQHMNTILDYSLFWIISIENYYNMTGDMEFLNLIYPKMESMMQYCMEQLDVNGFIFGRPMDWVFIDWSDIDKEGAISEEQFLLARSYQAMIHVNQLLGKKSDEYENLFENLICNIRKYFWDEEKGAFIDSYQSGRRKVSRHSNIFAILFDYASNDEIKSIVDNVLTNPEVTAITTPYFKFYELEVMAKLGFYQEVLENINHYWGGMLDKGASTFWEEYKPDESEDNQYGMYGDPYGKSLCHAWGASPVYLIGRYLVGLRSTSVGYETFEIAPQTDLLGDFKCEFPINSGTVKLNFHKGILTIFTDKSGGVLKLHGQEINLKAGETFTTVVSI